MTSRNGRPMPVDPVDILEESVAIDAAHGELAGVLAYPLAGVPTRAALVVGPHPLMGGRLENNVVRSVARGLAEYGLTTLRFAFAGDGPTSEVMDEFWRTGHAPDDPARVDDARSAAIWFAHNVIGPTVLVGYSFGASILAEMIDLVGATQLVLICPTIAHHDFTEVARSSLPKLVIASNNDFATPLDAVETWAARCAGDANLIVLESAEHFFRGQEDRLVGEITTWLHP